MCKPSPTLSEIQTMLLVHRRLNDQILHKSYPRCVLGIPYSRTIADWLELAHQSTVKIRELPVDDAIPVYVIYRSGVLKDSFSIRRAWDAELVLVNGDSTNVVIVELNGCELFTRPETVFVDLEYTDDSANLT